MEMKLNNENYHSTEARKLWMGYSQFKDFCECEYGALQKVLGNIKEETSDAFLQGGYFDAYFSEEMEQFKALHPELFKKDGTLLAKYQQVEKCIQVAKEDPMISKYWGGQHQVIMTGEIANVPFKIKIDSYFPGKAIVDGKLMRDFKPVWIEKDGRNTKVNFVEAYRYDLEGAIYQEIERQNSKQDKLPFILDAVSKEENPDKALLSIDQEDLDLALQEVIEKAPRFQKIKLGEIEPTRCGKCAACRQSKRITGILSYHTLDENKSEEEGE